MQPATAPGWQPPPTPYYPSGQNRSLLVALIGLALYVGLLTVGFYLGVCWLQNSMGELTLAVRELKTLLVLKASIKPE